MENEEVMTETLEENSENALQDPVVEDDVQVEGQENQEEPAQQTQQVQSREDNKAYKAMRQNMEHLQQQLEEERAQRAASDKDYQILMKGLKANGFDMDPRNTGLYLLAKEKGTSVEAVAAALEQEDREAQEAENAAQQQGAIQQENDELKEMLREFIYEKDVREINAMLRKTKQAGQIKSVKDLGPEFGQYRRSGLDACQSFNALMATRAARGVPEMGPVGMSHAESEYFTSAEIDALTPKQLQNPKIMAKVDRSLARLKG